MSVAVKYNAGVTASVAEAAHVLCLWSIGSVKLLYADLNL